MMLRALQSNLGDPELVEDSGLLSWGVSHGNGTQGCDRTSSELHGFGLASVY